MGVVCVIGFGTVCRHGTTYRENERRESVKKTVNYRRSQREKTQM